MQVGGSTPLTATKMTERMTIGEFLAMSVNNSNAQGELWALQMSSALNTTVEHVRWMVRHYGCGHIYTPTGLVMEDVPRLRHKLTAAFKTVVVITADGDIYIRGIEQNGAMGRKERAKRQRIERRKERKERDVFRGERSREHMFADCQGVPSPKRQGKGNSLGDLGLYGKSTVMTGRVKVHSIQFEVSYR